MDQAQSLTGNARRVTSQELHPHQPNPILLAPNLHPVIPQNMVLPPRRLNNCDSAMQRHAVRGGEVNAFDVMMTILKFSALRVVLILRTYAGRNKWTCETLDVALSVEDGVPAKSCSICVEFIHFPLTLQYKQSVSGKYHDVIKWPTCCSRRMP